MSLAFTWVDVLLVALLGASVALGAKRGLPSVISAVAALLAWAPINLLGLASPVLGLAVACAVGLVAGALSRRAASNLISLSGLPEATRMMLGGFGGLLVGLGLVMALTMSFPVFANARDRSGYARYPSPNLPALVVSGVSDSAIARFLTASPAAGGLGVWQAKGWLHDALIPDWNRR